MPARWSSRGSAPLGPISLTPASKASLPKWNSAALPGGNAATDAFVQQDGDAGGDDSHFDNGGLAVRGGHGENSTPCQENARNLHSANEVDGRPAHGNADGAEQGGLKR